MSWVAVGIAGVSGLAANQNEKAQRKAMQKHNLGQAEMTRYQNWTGKGGQITPYAGSELGATLGGAAQGFAFGSQFGGAKPQKPTNQFQDGGLAMNTQTPSIYSSMKKNNPYGGFGSGGMMNG